MTKEIDTSRAVSNVIAFRRQPKHGDHPFEVVEISYLAIAIPQLFEITLAGPHHPVFGGRWPRRRQARFPADQANAAVDFARSLAAEHGVSIVDLAGVLGDQLPDPEGSPHAA